MELIYKINEPVATEVSISGGKGASLAKTIQSLPVPDGLILSCYAYQLFITPLLPEINRLLSKKDQEVEITSQQIRHLILQASIPDNLTHSLNLRLDELQLTDIPLAVRSSGTLEDMPGAAFAGQHDTLLGIKTLPNLLDAIRQCYASLWHTHVMFYRQHLNLPHTQASMAIVLQRMIDVQKDEAAGVAFSVDPVQGSLSTVLINSAFGLGETVVAGEDPIDEFIIERKNLALKSKTITEKINAIVMAENGTEILPLEHQNRSISSLTPEQCKQVAELAISAEKYFDFPQDIEWAFHNGKLWLLQSRNVTQIAPIWTREESAERFPNPITPLTWDMCEAGFHSSLNFSLNLMGLPSFNGKWFGMQDYYIYGNQNAVSLYSNRLPTSMMNDLPTLLKSLPEIAQKFSWVQELPITWMRDLDKYLISIGALMNEPLQDKNLSQLWDYVQKINKLGADYFLPNIAISLTQRSLYSALMALLKLFFKEEKYAHTAFDNLIAMSETKTGQVNAELWVLSRYARQYPNLLTCIEQSVPENIMQEIAQCDPHFHQQFTLFLTNHGHRELDFDAYHPTWLDAPHIVLAQIKAMADLSDDKQIDDPLSKKILQSETEFSLISDAPEELRFFLQEIIRLARVYTALDDLEHYQTTRLALPMRRGLKALGERLVIRSVLDCPMDIYFANEQPLAKAILADNPTSWNQLRHHIYQNKAGYLKAKSVTPQWIYGEDSADEINTNDQKFKGLAGSAGIIEGNVYLVHGPENFAEFPQNAILVARTTNPAWTALFYRASGIITESGGPLSHGAVTARELGLPAVMGVRNILNILKNGQKVKVDGQKGVIEILS
ncbi:MULTISPECIES: PEP/pyruvate-binding domain-containing protein [Gammaproteobacteria]|uniref:PEP/pyruvate-binding domain-containing protein n=1 Tax=Gammaproteobacteria TaxID=1236 RepID=UPI001865DC9F|nr:MULTISPECIES: PEP/pyruvate-binding domain-containing protein [Gammaproteobacteria]